MEVASEPRVPGLSSLAPMAGLPAPERRLLLVDDEPNILSALRRLLRKHGYAIKTAESGQEALAIMDAWMPDVILTDQRMPGMSGVSFLRAAKDSHPDAVRIVLSGYTDLESVTSAINDGAVWKFLTKPWDDARLCSVLEEAFRAKELADENLMLRGAVAKACEQLELANARLEAAMAERGAQREAARAEAAVYQEVFEIAPLGLVALDEDGVIVNANSQARWDLGDPSPLGALFSDFAGALEGKGLAARFMPMGRLSSAKGSLAALERPSSLRKGGRDD